MSDKQKNISDQSFSENRTTGAGADKTDSTGTDKGTKRPAPMRGPRNLKPIIMSLILFLGLGSHRLQAQLETTVSLTGTYSDNVFQLSEHDLRRFDQDHQNLSFVNTSDDLSLALKADLAWPLRYKWWKFTPSVTGTISQNVSNTSKQRRDVILRLRTDRYYWNFTAAYGYYPFIYVRDYVDTDGTSQLESFDYGKNLWRGDLNLRPLRKTTVQLHARHEQYFYNQYWTEYDGNATTLGLGVRHSFPLFTLGAIYHWRSFENSGAKDLDSSYESNIYTGSIRLRSMPLSDDNKKGPTWHPSLALSYEERFFQSGDAWYGNREYKIYNTQAGLNFLLNPKMNISLDYSHTFRNVESPLQTVLRSKEYSENKVSATVKYSL